VGRRGEEEQERLKYTPTLCIHNNTRQRQTRAATSFWIFFMSLGDFVKSDASRRCVLCVCVCVDMFRIAFFTTTAMYVCVDFYLVLTRSFVSNQIFTLYSVIDNGTWMRREETKNFAEGNR